MYPRSRSMALRGRRGGLLALAHRERETSGLPLRANLADEEHTRQKAANDARTRGRDYARRRSSARCPIDWGTASERGARDHTQMLATIQGAPSRSEIPIAFSIDLTLPAAHRRARRFRGLLTESSPPGHGSRQSRPPACLEFPLRSSPGLATKCPDRRPHRPSTSRGGGRRPLRTLGRLRDA